MISYLGSLHFSCGEHLSYLTSSTPHIAATLAPRRRCIKLAFESPFILVVLSIHQNFLYSFMQILMVRRMDRVKS